MWIVNILTFVTYFIRVFIRYHTSMHFDYFMCISILDICLMRTKGFLDSSSSSFSPFVIHTISPIRLDYRFSFAPAHVSMWKSTHTHKKWNESNSKSYKYQLEMELYQKMLKNCISSDSLCPIQKHYSFIHLLSLTGYVKLCKQCTSSDTRFNCLFIRIYLVCLFLCLCLFILDFSFLISFCFFFFFSLSFFALCSLLILFFFSPTENYF